MWFDTKLYFDKENSRENRSECNHLEQFNVKPGKTEKRKEAPN